MNTLIDIPDEQKLKTKAKSIIENLTNLSPTLHFLNEPLVDGDQHLANFQLEVKNINSSHPLSESISLYLFSRRKTGLKAELEEILGRINIALERANKLLSGYSYSLNELKETQCLMSESEYKNNLFSIIVQNELKLANMQQQLDHGVSKANKLESFIDINLYHFNETMTLKYDLSNKLPNLPEIQSQIKKFESSYSFTKIVLSWFSGFMLFISFSNFLVSNFVIQYKSVIEKEVPLVKEISDFSPLSKASASISKSVDTVATFGNGLMILASIPLVASGVVHLWQHFAKPLERTHESSLQDAIHYLIGGFGILLINHLCQKMLAPEVKTIEVPTIITYEFYNLGTAASLYTLCISLTAILILFLYIRYKAEPVNLIKLFKDATKSQGAEH
ncbi:hypothetical protein AMD27_16420 (plasmid) [Acinetobacter sp. TGL-Y2]|uniref:hypothetical protein n=1 Tax=Acinetobacter sp. TGL-Y2 TaxID=1407071 RepID=UPI0007A68135|nr:hypothetical protein [Acinetobacter sp. TGL-Y2]AMW80500.1 hypothetical protein AMD27_16420 [Acinetobacter sp. TGL-Y2]